MDVLHVGRNEEEGYFYYVMELADDQVVGQEIRSADYTPRTLQSELAAREPLPAEEVIGLGAELAEALEYLHGHGLIHRDIKPSNIIFVHGRPKLADIGLVAGAGMSSFSVGTLGFLPDEGTGDPRADRDRRDQRRRRGRQSRLCRSTGKPSGRRPGAAGAPGPGIGLPRQGAAPRGVRRPDSACN